MAPLARYFPSGLCREHMKIIWNSMLLSHPLSNTSNLLVPGLTGWLANKASSFLVRLMQNVYQGIQQARRGNWKNQIETKQYFLTYAILRMNFPLMSKEYSFFPLSTSKMFTFPTWVLVARYWELGEKAKVHSSTGPASTDFIYLFFSNCQRRIWASREWDAAMGRVWLKSTNNNSADGSPDSTVGPASHHAISRPSLGHPGILWPLFQSLFCLTLKQLIRWHHHGCALVWREHCTGWSLP